MHYRPDALSGSRSPDPFSRDCHTISSTSERRNKFSEASGRPTPAKTDATGNPAASKSWGMSSTAVIVNTDLITLTVTVTDTYGRYVSGLSQKASPYSTRKKTAEITSLARRFASFGRVIFDVSGSMSCEKIRTRGKRCLSLSQPATTDEYFLIAFNSRASCCSIKLAMACSFG